MHPQSAVIDMLRPVTARDWNSLQPKAGIIGEVVIPDALVAMVGVQSFV